ncbi:MAG: hypothetical protein U0S50_03445 [Sphingopyxis sp.]|uniref:hypothetical protein n=1 Tax=Sphingopyxis sp. TaxID=1908224 RepID=UPI002AB815F3|nr:hypothetical protein [Sphingopyxis sp.]MDZ3830858.1 hypothetical protein [Sphingopyxis sp.]
MRMVDKIRSVLASLGGEATLQAIYDEIARQFSIPVPSWRQAGIRKEIQRHSSASALWNGARPDYFYSVHGKGKGVWGLR